MKSTTDKAISRPAEGINTGNIINVCYSSDQNYAKYMALSMATVLNTKAPDDNIHFYILDGGISDKDKQKILNLKRIAPCEITFITVDKDKFKNFPLEHTKSLTLSTYYRLLLPDFLPNLDKVIYFDCDIEARGSLKDLYNTEISLYPLAMAEDIDADFHCKRLNLNSYYNAGMLLLNLQKLREEKFTEKVFDFIEENSEKLYQHDQDVLNLYFKNQIKELDPKWNYNKHFTHTSSFMKKVKTAQVIHYLGGKWGFILMNCPLFLKTGYKLEFTKLYIKSVIKFIVSQIFQVRNADNRTQKEITILGFTFYINKKLKAKEE